LLAALPALAGEYAVLQNGFRIRAERHETAGAQIRLQTDTGTVELPATQVVAFEQEEYVPPKPAPPPAAVAATEVAPPPSAQQLVENAAVKHGLRPEFVRSVAKAESGFRPDAVSAKGAIGLMQLMPGTAADLGADPKDPAQNAEAGARYLRQLLDKYRNQPDGVRLAIAAYNAGPAAVDRHRNVPPYRETQAYVERVVKNYLKQLEANP
jgi:soluble lytic murein transglycosylase-like protein